MSENSRSKKAVFNTASYMVGIIVEIIISLILPRLILEKFGSGNNGLTASIEQFLSYSSLLYIGLMGSTRAVLYKPLSTQDQDGINRIMAATQYFMKKVTVITLIALIVFSCVYPFFVRNEFTWLYASSLTLIIGVNTLFQYYFGMPCRIILAADQKNYILTIIDITTLFLSSIVSVILIYCTNSIHLVKIGAICARVVGPVALHIYVKKHYHLNYNVKPDMNNLGQRWDAGAHSIANFVNKNTDIVILTLFTNIKEVSVYTIYYLVINGLNKIGTAISSGLEGAFGNIIAKNQIDSLKRNLSAYETVMYMVSIVLYTCCALLIVSFVKIYTKGVNDVSYDRVIFAYLVSIVGLFTTLRMPYQTVVQAAGKYKETRNGALLEAIINIVLSLLLVIKFGLIGVSIGTAVAMCFRTTQYAIYAYRNIVHVSVSKFVIRIIFMIIQIAIIIGLSRLIPCSEGSSYSQWILYSIPIFTISVIVTFVFSILIWRDDMIVLINMLKRSVR